LAKDGLLKAFQLPDMVRRRMIHAIHRLFKIPIHHFYNPDLAKPQS